MEIHAVAGGEDWPTQIGQRDAWYLPHGDARRDLAGLEVRYQIHDWPVRIPRAKIIIFVLGALLTISIVVIAWLMIFRDSSVPDPRDGNSAAEVGGAGSGVDPRAFSWLIGDWGYANCSTIVHIARAPGGIAVTAGSGQPGRERVRSANAAEVVTDTARYVRDSDQVRWLSGNTEITRLVPCREGAEEL